MKFLSDFQAYGFDETEIIAFLVTHGINIGDPSAQHKPSTKPVPHWKQVMALLPHLTLTEVVSAFVGLDPASRQLLSAKDQADFSRYQSLITRSIEKGELLAEAVQGGRTGDDWIITPTDLMAWCSSKGMACPLPGRVAFQMPENELRNALESCEQERAEWKTKAKSLEAEAAQLKTRQAEIAQLRNELRAKTEEVSALTADLAAVKSDVMSGKTKTTTLKLIGGLAITGHGMDIHAERLDGIAEMLRDLEKVGAGVTEKTLREKIKEAAGIIEPPNRKR